MGVQNQGVLDVLVCAGALVDWRRSLFTRGFISEDRGFQALNMGRIMRAGETSCTRLSYGGRCRAEIVHPTRHIDVVRSGLSYRSCLLAHTRFEIFSARGASRACVGWNGHNSRRNPKRSAWTPELLLAPIRPVMFRLLDPDGFD